MSSRPFTLHTEHIHSNMDRCRVDLSPYIQNTYILTWTDVESTFHPTYRTHTFQYRQMSSRPFTLHTEHIHSNMDRCRVDLSPYIQNTYILIWTDVESTFHPTYRTHTFQYRQMSSRPFTIHTEHIHCNMDRCRVDLLSYIQNTYILIWTDVESTF